MMKIKNIRRWAFTVAAIVLISFSCKDSFLEVPPTGSLIENQLNIAKGVEGVLIGAYSMLNGKGFNRSAGPNNWLFQILGGDTNKGTDPGDYGQMNSIQRYEVDPTSGEIEGIWQSKYEGVSRANAAIRLALSTTTISDAVRKRIVAEARTLRGHYYFSLKVMFNSIVYFDETVSDADLPKIPNSPDVWDKIEADFKFGMDNLPETQPEAGRVNKWAAAAYLGKALLYQKKYGEAKQIFDEVIAKGQTTNGKKYGLVASFSQIFNAENDNHEESVFAVQSSNNTGSTSNANWFDDLNYPYGTGLEGPGNCCGFNQPTFTMVNMYRTKNGLPLLDNSFNSKDNQLNSDYKIESGGEFDQNKEYKKGQFVIVLDADDPKQELQYESLIDGNKGNKPSKSSDKWKLNWAEETKITLDPRLDHTVGRRGIPYLDWREHPGKKWIRDQTYAGPYSPKKFVYYKTQENSFTDGSSWTRGYATMNVCIIRFADVLLMAAETEIEAGSLDKAREYINMVRARAAKPSTWVMEYNGSGPAANYEIALYKSFAGKDEAWKALKFERALELSQEGHRFGDLVRWGDVDSFINGIYLPFDSKLLPVKFAGARFTVGKNEYLPIPRAQIDLQRGVLVQNKGYN